MDNRKAGRFMLFLVLYYIAFMFLVLPLVFVFLGLDQYDLSQLAVSPWLLMLSQIFGLLLPLVIWTLFRGESLIGSIPRSPLSGKNVMLIIVISIFIQPTMMAVSGLTTLLFPNEIVEFVGEMGIQQSFWVMLLAVAVTPAIIEELVFRGYIQTATNHFSLKKAALINGLFFGIIHFNFQQFFYAFAMGIVFLVMVHYTKSIFAGILSHFIVNGSQVSLLQFMMWAQGFLDEYEVAVAADIGGEEIIGVIITIGILVLITLPITAVIFRHFILYNIERQESMEAEELRSASEGVPIEEEDKNIKPRGRFDPYIAVVIGVYLLIMVAVNFA